MQILWKILFILAGTILGGLQAIGNRRFDAYIRSREDYDEDVDGKMTKKEKLAAEEQKKEEAGRVWMPAKDVIRERPGRFLFCLLLGGAGASALVLQYGVNAATCTLLVFFTVMILISMIDLDTMEIPFSCNLFILGLAGLSFLTYRGTEPFSEITIVSRLIGMAAISVPMILLNLLISGAFGGGDVKLMIAAGFLLGWKITVTGFFIGVIIGGIVGVVVMARRKKGGKEHIPFGPSLCAGLAIAVIVGTQLIAWYSGVLEQAMSEQ